MKTHVYKLVLGFMFTLLCIATQAQEYTYIPMVKSGIQIWTDDYFHCEHYYYRRFTLTNEDTTIENQTYKKLYFFTDSAFNSSTAQCIGGLRENEQKQVFFKETNYIEECGPVASGMIYNFSLSVGDTLSSDGTCTFKVDSIETINYAGKERREFVIGIYFDTNTIRSFSIAHWIEGIGSTQGIVYDMNLNLITCQNIGVNRCYEYNGELQYHYGDVDCYTPLMGINEVEEKDNTVFLYPNPASESITIGSENIIKSIEIYNPLGQRVYQTKVNAKLKSIDINSLSKGIYIIGINTNKGYIKKKFIKN